jgi:hypothetical protein
MKQLAQFILAWFRSLESSYGLRSAKFDLSILGSRLIFMTAILDRHQVHNLWENGGRKAMTFVWLSNVRSLLHLYQRLVTASSLKREAGFLLTSPVTIDPTNRDGIHFLDCVQSFDKSIHHQWRANRLLSPQAFFDHALIPSSHFIPVSRPLPVPIPKVPTIKKEGEKKRPISTGTNDFVATQNLFDLAGANPNDRGGIASRFMGVNPPGAPMPKLLSDSENGQPGKLTLICFPSSVGAPFNSCCTSDCLHGQTSRKKNQRFKPTEGPTPFLHVDLSLPFFANQPEKHWDAVVQWLQLPGVSTAVHPSRFLKSKTPSTTW